MRRSVQEIGDVMTPTYDLIIKIAKVPFRVRCRCRETAEFLRPYMAEEAPLFTGDAAEDNEAARQVTPLFTIAPAPDDLLRMADELDRTAEKEGRRGGAYSEAYLEQNAVHALLAEQMVSRGVLLMHGSALSMDGRGYIFTAKSGTGKSTHARLWREVFGERVRMINDDKPMLLVQQGGVSVWGTPWDGKHHLSSNEGVPLAAIVQIRRAAENHIEPMAGADAFPLLMQQTYASADPATGMKILALQRQILEKTAFYTLDCNMDPEAALAAWEGITGAPGIPGLPG